MNLSGSGDSRSADYDSFILGGRVSQAGSLRAVPVDGFVKLDFGNLEKPDHHGLYLATTSSSSRAATSPRR